MHVQWGAYVDAYYMYDLHARSGNVVSHPLFNPIRHNEFNINLAQVRATFIGNDVRGVLALQTGTGVGPTYSAETSNRTLAQLIGEAWAGYRVMNTLWLDAGIYPAPYGFEGWLSRDNKTYSPSLVANFSPFYQSGLRATWQAREDLAVGFNLINGWQNIAETNSTKSVGLSVSWNPASKLAIVYNNFIGNEEPDSLPGVTRFFNDLCFRWTLSDFSELDLTTDYGMRNMSKHRGSWQGVALIGRFSLAKQLALVLRGEYYADKDQAMYVTGTQSGFQGGGASVTVNVMISSQLLYRVEARILCSQSAVFPSANGLRANTGFVVSAVSLTL